MIGIVILRLLVKVESTIWPWIIAHSSQIHPISIVAAGIIINELIFEVSSPVQPVLSEVVNQVGGDILSPSVTHPPGLRQFVHIGVDEIILCSPELPFFKSPRVSPPLGGALLL